MSRTAGRYILTGAAFERAGERYRTGDTVELDAEEAERLAKAFEPARGRNAPDEPEAKPEK